jgi:hypothetical protein
LKKTVHLAQQTFVESYFRRPTAARVGTPWKNLFRKYRNGSINRKTIFHGVPNSSFFCPSGPSNLRFYNPDHQSAVLQPQIVFRRQAARPLNVRWAPSMRHGRGSIQPRECASDNLIAFVFATACSVSARYAVHCAVEDTSGGNGEASMAGRSSIIEDPVKRSTLFNVARAHGFHPSEGYVLFGLTVDRAESVKYEDGQVKRRAWKISSCQ